MGMGTTPGGYSGPSSMEDYRLILRERVFLDSIAVEGMTTLGSYPKEGERLAPVLRLPSGGQPYIIEAYEPVMVRVEEFKPEDLEHERKVEDLRRRIESCVAVRQRGLRGWDLTPNAFNIGSIYFETRDEDGTSDSYIEARMAVGFFCIE